MVEGILLTAALFFGNLGKQIPKQMDNYFVARVVQHEAGGLSENYRANIAAVIRARMESEEFPNTAIGNIFADNQFTGVWGWIFLPKYAPDAETIQAVKNAFDYEPIHNCTYYYNPEYSTTAACNWFEYSGDVEYKFSLTETSWGITYTTRFFEGT